MMNKKVIIDCYSKERSTPSKLASLFKDLEEYLSREPLNPEFIA